MIHLVDNFPSWIFKNENFEYLEISYFSYSLKFFVCINFILDIIQTDLYFIIRRK